MDKSLLPKGFDEPAISFEETKQRCCIKISDKIILNNKIFFTSFKTDWWYIGNVHEGLEYHGITIICDENIIAFINVLRKFIVYKNIRKLINLCKYAFDNNEAIVHCFRNIIILFITI